MSRISDHRDVLSAYETIIFDLDGTLYDSEQFYAGVFADMAQWLVEKGFQKQRYPWINCMMGLKQAKGNDYHQLMDDALQLLKIDVNVKTTLLKIYKEHDCRYMVLHHDEASCLEYLKHCNKQLFIITNGQRKLQKRKIEQLGLNQYMKEVIVLDPLEDKILKPDHASFYYLRQKYKMGKTIMVGDRFDIDGIFAQNSGIDFVGVGFYGN